MRTLELLGSIIWWGTIASFLLALLSVTTALIRDSCRGLR
jgi:hypothetical protein